MGGDVEGPDSRCRLQLVSQGAMAGFKAHLTSGLVSGTFFSVAGWGLGVLGATQAGAVFILGAVAALLPDLDSDTGKPLTFLSQVVSVLLPSLVWLRIGRGVGFSPEALICYFTGGYLLVYHGVCGLIRRLTTHRGMMHSLPFCLICAGLTYLLLNPSGRPPAAWAALTVGCGCMLHLMLDEYHAVYLRFGFIPAVRRSRGTAFKLRSDSLPGTLFTYGLTALVTGAVWVEVFRPELLQFRP
jgi:membrane-bound metal-dependent hydrolase YbcI (DUF457 family)